MTSVDSKTQALDAALQEALAHHQAGSLQQAEQLYRAILEVEPYQAESNHRLGLLAGQLGQHEAGLRFLQTAVAVAPSRGEYWLSYVRALLASGQAREALNIIHGAMQRGFSAPEAEALRQQAESAAQGGCAARPAEKQGSLPGAQSESGGAAPVQPAEPAKQKHEDAAKKIGKAARKTKLPRSPLRRKVLPPVEADQLFALFKAGHYTELEIRARMLLDRYPDSGVAWKGLGVALQMQGKEALAALRKVTELLPEDAEAHFNLGNALQNHGQTEAALASFRNALKIKPDLADAHFSLGMALSQMGRLEDAAASYRRTLALKPGLAEAHLNLGTVLQSLGQLDDAVASYRSAIGIAPRFAEAHSNLGATLKELGQSESALASCRRALEIKPDLAEAHSNLGNALRDLGDFEGAVASYRRALEIKPGLTEACCNLGSSQKDLGQIVGAVASYRRALETRPESAEALQGLSAALAQTSDFREVVAQSDAALRLKPDAPIIWEQRLYTYSYHPDLSAAEIFAEFVRWGDRFPDPEVDFSGHDRNVARRLRVGYVSPDFRRHTSRFFFWPLFANHDPSVVELYAYSNVQVPDEFTTQFKGLFEHWREIRGVSDTEVAKAIRDDGIDILVDCCNHMRDDRLGVFTLKPAPIQVTWLGAAWTTGLKAVDYALIDPYMAPEGTLARENIVRLPHFFVAFRPPEETAQIAAPPCMKNGYVTFGYSGRTERLNHRTFRVWGEILRRVPDARLILDFSAFADPPTQAHYAKFMARFGVDLDRVLMRKSSNIFEGLNDFDILLDCFPHSGGTMLFDALWMGVPALTLASRPPVGRIGTSLMMNLGLPEWVATDEDDYIDKACAFAGDPPALVPLRAGMRERMRNSPVMDGAGFARGVEGAYREMFFKWANGATKA